LLIVRSASIARLFGVIVTGLGVVACARVVTAASMLSASVRTASRPVKMPLKKGQMKPKQLEIARLRARSCEAEGRTRHPKKAAAYFAKEST
jgi:hypothetical protein